jgi:trehalose 6-phosphate phosphatase
VREAHPEIGARSAELLAERAADVTGAHVKPGHGVVELLARSTSKATAMGELQREYGARHIAFVGDDRTDEEVFAAIAGDGCSIRVGRGPTAAAHRLAGPPEVLAFLQALTRAL